MAERWDISVQSPLCRIEVHRGQLYTVAMLRSPEHVSLQNIAQTL